MLKIAVIYNIFQIVENIFSVENGGYCYAHARGSINSFDIYLLPAGSVLKI